MSEFAHSFLAAVLRRLSGKLQVKRTTVTHSGSGCMIQDILWWISSMIHLRTLSYAKLENGMAARPIVPVDSRMSLHIFNNLLRVRNSYSLIQFIAIHCFY